MVVVTGASGHVGGNLVRALLARGRRVRVIVHRDTRAIEGLDAERVSADTLDIDSLVRAFDGARTVYHLAGVISIMGEMNGLVNRTNVIGTGNVVQACLKQGVRRLVHFSSIHALRHESGLAQMNESCGYADGGECLAYDRSKAMGEQKILEGISLGLDAVIVNPTSIIGPYDFKPSRMGQVLLDLYHRRMPALIDAVFDWVDVRDVVAGAMSAEEKGRCGERYLLSGSYESIKGLARLVEEISGVRAPRFVTPMWLALLAAPFAEFYAGIFGKTPLFTRESMRVLRESRPVSHEKATRELGYEPRPLRNTIEDSLAWFRQAGML